MRNSIIILSGVLSLWVCLSEARPGLFYTYPQASQQTTVLRDALGNQATSYSYQDGHSSSVAVSRNDVSKHLTYVPVVAPAPVIYEEPHHHLAYAAPPAYHHLPSSPDYYGTSYYNYY